LGGKRSLLGFGQPQLGELQLDAFEVDGVGVFQGGKGHADAAAVAGDPGVEVVGHVFAQPALERILVIQVVGQVERDGGVLLHPGCDADVFEQRLDRAGFREGGVFGAEVAIFIAGELEVGGDFRLLLRAPLRCARPVAARALARAVATRALSSRCSTPLPADAQPPEAERAEDAGEDVHITLYPRFRVLNTNAG
jgi:hypothetical protein